MSGSDGFLFLIHLPNHQIQRKEGSPTGPFLGGLQGRERVGLRSICSVPTSGASPAQLHALDAQIYKPALSTQRGRGSSCDEVSHGHWHIEGARSHTPSTYLPVPKALCGCWGERDISSGPALEVPGVGDTPRSLTAEEALGERRAEGVRVGTQNGTATATVH